MNKLFYFISSVEKNINRNTNVHIHYIILVYTKNAYKLVSVNSLKVVKKTICLWCFQVESDLQMNVNFEKKYFKNVLLNKINF